MLSNIKLVIYIALRLAPGVLLIALLCFYGLKLQRYDPHTGKFSDLHTGRSTAGAVQTPASDKELGH